MELNEMKLCCTATDAQWGPIEPRTAGQPGGDADALTPNRDAMHRAMLDMLRADNLIVLCGLGASCCVTGADDVRLAPTMSDLWNGVKEKVGEAFEPVLKQVKYDIKKCGEDIELLLSRCQLAQAFEDSKNLRDFIESAEALIVEKCSFVTDNVDLTTHELFLRRVARRSTRHARAKVFTTNYDRCLEAAASRARFIAIDGFSHTLPQEFDSGYFAYDLVRREGGEGTPDYIPNVFHLYKLHGSVDWERRGAQVGKGDKPKRPLLIFPRHTKFETSYNPPFVDLMASFQMTLRQPNTALLVIGFGFNDNHLTQPILSAIRSNVGIRIAVVAPGLETSKNDAINMMLDLVKGGDPRIALIAARFEHFVPELPDLVATTEEEQHRSRIRGGRP